MDLQKKLIEIQRSLKAPKSQYNLFGKYYYRNCEDILEALKPLLAEHQVLLDITDTIENIGNRFYVKATVTVRDNKECYSCSAYAREEETKKGMDGAQVTGSSSSYARKYALNGLFLIDDTKDADSHDNTKTAPTTVVVQKVSPHTPQKIKPSKEQIVEFLKKAQKLEQLDTIYKQALTYEWSDADSLFLMEHKEAEETRIRSSI